MIQSYQSDIEQQLLQAFTWLAQYTPVLVCSRDSISHVSLLNGIFFPVWSATSGIENERSQALDTIHDAMQSSLFKPEEPMEIFYTDPSKTWSISFDRTILLDFWLPLICFHDYWIARFEKIKQSTHARLVCCQLLKSLILYPEDTPLDQQKLQQGLLLTYLFEEYSAEPRRAHTTYFTVKKSICTCASSGHSKNNDAREANLLIDASGCDEDQPTQTRFLAIVDAKQVFLGGIAESTQGGGRILQIALPLQHVVSGHTAAFPSYFRRKRANVRLICLKTPLICDGIGKSTHFDLSVTLTSYILDFWTAAPRFQTVSDLPRSKSTEIVFTGALQQREDCLQSITQEVWKNTDNQLDAWSQLYVLACVKKGSSTYWKIAASDAGSEEGKITDETELVP